MQITEIEKIGKGARYRLFVDGQLLGVFEGDILAKHCLKCGQEFEKNFFDELIIENGDYACFNRSLNLLEKSMKSKKTLKDFLYEKGYPKSCIEKAISKLEEYGYINDKTFCENYIFSYNSSKSQRKIKYDLLSKGIKEDIIENALDKFKNEEDEREKCLKFAGKYMKNKVFDLKNKQKMFNHLAGKGFDYDDISYSWEKLKNDMN